MCARRHTNAYDATGMAVGGKQPEYAGKNTVEFPLFFTSQFSNSNLDKKKVGEVSLPTKGGGLTRHIVHTSCTHIGLRELHIEMQMAREASTPVYLPLRTNHCASKQVESECERTEKKKTMK